MTRPAPTPLVSIRGDATEEEVAALLTVLQVLAAQQAGRASAAARRPTRVSGWSAPGRLVRQTFRHGPGGWRASALPR